MFESPLGTALDADVSREEAIFRLEGAIGATESSSGFV
jgi:hypothetical protein